MITRGKLDSFLEDIKEHIKSTAKGTEAVLTERMGERFERVEAAISTHSGMIKELGEKIDAVETRLTEKIEAVDARLTAKIDSVETRLTEKIEAVDTRLTGVETRLGDKIDSIHVRLDDHEVRIAALEAPAKP